MTGMFFWGIIYQQTVLVNHVMVTQAVITCSMLTTDALEQGVKHVQSWQ